MAPAPPRSGVDKRPGCAHDRPVRGITTAQERTATNLSHSQVGAYVRSCGDGSLELLTLERGGFRRWVVHRDGAATLVESRRPSSSQIWGHVLLVGGGVLAFAMVALILSPLVAGSAFTAAIVFVGLIACGIGETVMNSALAPGGDGWEKIGGADF
jgi:hypothetical protein